MLDNPPAFALPAFALPPFALEVREIEWVEPAEAVLAFAADPHLVWLDSGGPPGALNRYSYIAAAPFLVLTDADGADPFAALAAALARWQLPRGCAPVPFAGGAVGFFGYGAARYLERLPARHVAAQPGMVMGFYDTVLAYDRLDQRSWVLSSGLPETGAARPERAAQRADEMLALLAARPAQTKKDLKSVDWNADLSPELYRERVGRILDYIKAGDIFQANFTTGFHADRPDGITPLDIHLALRAKNPAPFGAFLACGDSLALAGISPERFISLDADGRLETRPIKGTAPRGRDPIEDLRLQDGLRHSEKDRAENLMIVDLMRNDLGRVAAIGSVRVEALWRVETHPGLHHLVSVVSARLRPGLGAVDVLRAAFPGGSVTGAPKLRAMEVIDELEAAARGAYCGITCWIGFDGAMDSSIIIRTVAVTEAQITAQAGGGIVADSNPVAEYEEMLLKINPLLRVFEGAR
jgi:para-aminobenzoate synthetase component 1